MRHLLRKKETKIHLLICGVWSASRIFIVSFYYFFFFSSRHVSLMPLRERIKRQQNSDKALPNEIYAWHISARKQKYFYYCSQCKLGIIWFYDDPFDSIYLHFLMKKRVLTPHLKMFLYDPGKNYCFGAVKRILLLLCI